MIWTNRAFKAWAVKMPFGDLQAVTMGEEGRGRKRIIIPSSFDLEAGLNEGKTIALSKTGKPKVVQGDAPGLFLFVDTKGGYTRRGDGKVLLPKGSEQKVVVLAEGNSADGDAGGIGYASAYVIQVVEGDLWLRIVQGGGNPSRVVYITSDMEVIDLGLAVDDRFALALDHYDLECPGTDVSLGRFFADVWAVL